MLPENILNIFKNLRVLDVSNTAIKCNFNATVLHFLAMTKSADIIGSPCFGYSSKFARFMKKQSEIFEKIITPDLSSEINSKSSEECRCRECRCPEIVLENSVKTSTKRPTEIPERRKSSQHEDRSMKIWLVFFYGLIIGAALTMPTILYWIYCCNDRNRSNNLPQRPAQCNNIPNETHETLPSSYTDPQRPAQCNNFPNETHETLTSSYTDPQRPAQSNNIPNFSRRNVGSKSYRSLHV